ncbi:hypothetical protein HDE_12065 [Halotydeus destructor]|nr:hypothetical protein HDE_12065 [Halotydeus destructor]
MMDKSGLGNIGLVDHSLRPFVPRLRSLARRIAQITGDLYRASLGDEAQVLKAGLVELSSQSGPTSSWGNDGSLFEYRNREKNAEQIEKRISELDFLATEFEKKNSEFRQLNPSEQVKIADSNRKTLDILNVQRIKLFKKCHYYKSRANYLINEMETQTLNKNLIEKLVVWKRFIENNEYVLKQQLTRAERELHYSFLAKKLRDSEADIYSAEELVFAIV